MSSVSKETAKRKRDFFDGLYSLDESENDEELYIPQTVSSMAKDTSRPKNTGIIEEAVQPNAPRHNLPQPRVKDSAAPKLFQGLNFYFVPNKNVNAARRFRIEKAEQYGALWVKTWNHRVTHIIVDKDITQAEVLQHLHLSTIPVGTALVKKDYPADCIRDGMILNSQHPRYRLKGSKSTEEVHQEQKPVNRNADRAERAPKIRLNQAADTLRTCDPANPSCARPHKSLAPEIIAASNKKTTARSLNCFQGSTSNWPGDTSSAFEDARTEARTISLIPLELEDGENASFAAPREDDSESDRPPSKRSRKNPEPIQNSDFKCMQPGDGTISSSNPNQRTISVLQQMCDYYTRTNDHWRTIAYRRGVAALKKQPQQVTSAASASRIPGIGSRLASKIEEIVLTGRLQRLENTTLDENDRLLQLFTGIYQVGFAQANMLIAKGYRTFSDLANSKDLSTNQRIGLEHYSDFQQRIPRAEIEALADIVRATLSEADSQLQAIIGGSYRRGAADSGDIDLIITKDGGNLSDIRTTVFETVIPRLESVGFIKASFTKTQSSKWHGACALSSNAVWRRIDLLFVPSSELGAALIYFTGNDIFNRSIRLLASKKGMRLNQHGLFRDVMRGPAWQKATEGKLVEGQDEERIFQVLGVPWKTPEERIC